MTKEEARRKYYIAIACGVKFSKDTPDTVRQMIMEYVLDEDEDKKLPVSLHPYKPNITLLRRMYKLFHDLQINCSDEIRNELEEEVENKTEDEFIEMYKQYMSDNK